MVFGLETSCTQHTYGGVCGTSQLVIVGMLVIPQAEAWKRHDLWVEERQSLFTICKLGPYTGIDRGNDAIRDLPTTSTTDWPKGKFNAASYPCSCFSVRKATKASSEILGPQFSQQERIEPGDGGVVGTEGYSKNDEPVLWHPAKILAGAGCIARPWPHFSLAKCVAQAVDSDPAFVN
ncbi:hypothetical protein ARMGADRAFT_1061792 [Armillaria gallica]|uniref:Uncharacterized protein n=1 Tax=Armillaria gallica TaxID=47427 RepID=A0A2H3DQL9_ARMGA|nr:hypothetical protein ARMGADRAFT_1061792 [Armillaria gallica]